jgi:hypothetical protein
MYRNKGRFDRNQLSERNVFIHPIGLFNEALRMPPGSENAVICFPEEPEWQLWIHGLLGILKQIGGFAFHGV